MFHFSMNSNKQYLLNLLRRLVLTVVSTELTNHLVFKLKI